MALTFYGESIRPSIDSIASLNYCLASFLDYSRSSTCSCCTINVQFVFSENFSEINSVPSAALRIEPPVPTYQCMDIFLFHQRDPPLLCYAQLCRKLVLLEYKSCFRYIVYHRNAGKIYTATCSCRF